MNNKQALDKKFQEEKTRLKQSVILHIEFLEKHIKNLKNQLDLDADDYYFVADTFCNATASTTHLIMRDLSSIKTARNFWK